MSRLGLPAPGDSCGADTAVTARRKKFLSGLLGQQLIRFVLVGVVNSAFSFAVFASRQLTLGTYVHYLAVLVISHIAGVLEAYVLQRWLVFRVSGHWWRDLARFWSVYLVALGVNLVALPLLVELVGVPVLPAQAIVMLGTALGTFLVHRSFTFRRPQTAAVGPLPDGEQIGPVQESRTERRTVTLQDVGPHPRLSVSSDVAGNAASEEA